MEPNANLRLKNKIIEIKNSLDEPNHRVEVTEDGISELEGRAIEFTQTEQQRENTLPKDEQSQRFVGQQQKH